MQEAKTVVDFLVPQKQYLLFGSNDSKKSKYIIVDFQDPAELSEFLSKHLEYTDVLWNSGKSVDWVDAEYFAGLNYNGSTLTSWPPTTTGDLNTSRRDLDIPFDTVEYDPEHPLYEVMPD